MLEEWGVFVPVLITYVLNTIYENYSIEFRSLYLQSFILTVYPKQLWVESKSHGWFLSGWGSCQPVKLPEGEGHKGAADRTGAATHLLLLQNCRCLLRSKFGILLLLHTQRRLLQHRQPVQVHLHTHKAFEDNIAAARIRLQRFGGPSRRMLPCSVCIFRTSGRTVVQAEPNTP